LKLFNACTEQIKLGFEAGKLGVCIFLIKLKLLTKFVNHIAKIFEQQLVQVTTLFEVVLQRGR